MNDVEKLDNVTWYGHCAIHFLTALKDLPDEAKLGIMSKFVEVHQAPTTDTA
jgi:hypothetical protein